MSVARVSTMDRVSMPSTTTHVAVPLATLVATVRLVGIIGCYFMKYTYSTLIFE